MIAKSTRVRPGSIEKDSPFYVPPILDMLGRLVDRFQGFWLWLGRLESAVLKEEFSNQPLAPIFICGLARSGSTLLHEVLASHPGTASLRMKDYPMVFTPYWWRQATRMVRPTPPTERPHRDKMMVSSESPDSIEEMLWMVFFPHCHDPKVDNRLQREDRHLRFETFYANHIRKLLLVERANRYIAKANYHVSRLSYLNRLFPKARFILPIRSPAGHIASLVRQHEWFSAGHRSSPRALAFMQRSGHFEFGLDRRPMNLGDSQRVEQIQAAWSEGREIAGWAMYWDMVYRYVADLLDADPAVRSASLVVNYERFCDDPATTLRAVLDHCELTDVAPILNKFAKNVRRPDYYKNSFSSDELATIRTHTAETAKRWGYETS
jgi:hypothetical protein